MEDNEEHTVQTLTAYRAVFSELVTHHHGRVVDSPGDNILAEFASAVEAVQCAVHIQQALHERNAHLPPRRQMLFRIGINLGDILVESERIYGDGVNIAARLEGLAKGGGICISQTVYDQVEGKLPFHYHALGDQQVKNIARPSPAHFLADLRSGSTLSPWQTSRRQGRNHCRRKARNPSERSASTFHSTCRT